MLKGDSVAKTRAATSSPARHSEATPARARENPSTLKLLNVVPSGTRMANRGMDAAPFVLDFCLGNNNVRKTIMKQQNSKREHGQRKPQRYRRCETRQHQLQLHRHYTRKLQGLQKESETKENILPCGFGPKMFVDSILWVAQACGMRAGFLYDFMTLKLRPTQPDGQAEFIDGLFVVQAHPSFEPPAPLSSKGSNGC